jgi:hypothetical protein
MPADAVDGYGPSREFLRRTLHLQRMRNLASHVYAEQLKEHGFAIGPAKIRLQNTSITQEQCTRVKLEQVVAASLVFGVSIEFLVGLTPCDLCDNQPPAGFTCTRCGRPGGERS